MNEHAPPLPTSGAVPPSSPCAHRGMDLADGVDVPSYVQVDNDIETFLEPCSQQSLQSRCSQAVGNERAKESLQGVYALYVGSDAPDAGRPMHLPHLNAADRFAIQRSDASIEVHEATSPDYNTWSIAPITIR